VSSAELAVSATPSFSRVAKLHARDKKVLDEAFKDVLSNSQMGDEKKGFRQACLTTSSNPTRRTRKVNIVAGLVMTRGSEL
jgi:hypothetical protein